jgi:hypothetical protein
MTDDEFPERLRQDAASLRYVADDVSLARLQARVRARVEAPASVAQLLAAWFRPIATSIAAVAFVAAIATTWYQETHDSTTVVTTDSMATTASVDIAVDGDTFSVTN